LSKQVEIVPVVVMDADYHVVCEWIY